MEGVYHHDKTALDPEGIIRKSVTQQLGFDIETFKTKLNLACGADYLHGWINLDGDKDVEADLHCELDSKNVELPLPDNSVDLIYASHILEHIWNLPQLKKELIRITKPGGYIVAVVPEFTSPDAWGDDTHCRAFSAASFSWGFWKGCKTNTCMPINITKKIPNSELTASFVWILGILQKLGDLDPEPVIMLNHTTEYCSDCGWCCEMANYPIPTSNYFTLDRVLKLSYFKGHKVYYEPIDKRWYIMHVDPCQYYDKVTKHCKIYGTGKRPKICKDFVCHTPGHIRERHDVLFKAAQNILKQKFGEKPDVS